MDHGRKNRDNVLSYIEWSCSNLLRTAPCWRRYFVASRTSSSTKQTLGCICCLWMSILFPHLFYICEIALCGPQVSELRNNWFSCCNSFPVSTICCWCNRMCGELLCNKCVKISQVVMQRGAVPKWTWLEDRKNYSLVRGGDITV